MAGRVLLVPAVSPLAVLPQLFPFVGLSLAVDALSAFFLLVISLVAAAAAIYGPAYLRAHLEREASTARTTVQAVALNARLAPPRHVSALMSGVMLKVAVYGIARFGFDLLAPAAGPLPPSWGRRRSRRLRPLNGFVSEWMTFQALLLGGASGLAAAFAAEPPAELPLRHR